MLSSSNGPSPARAGPASKLCPSRFPVESSTKGNRKLSATGIPDDSTNHESALDAASIGVNAAAPGKPGNWYPENVVAFDGRRAAGVVRVEHAAQSNPCGGVPLS